MTSHHIETVRFWALFLAGCVALSYAIGALATNHPMPFDPSLPMLAGALAAVVIFVAALLAGQQAAHEATDEGYFSDQSRATGAAFWIALLMYPAFAPMIAWNWISYETAFAAMGTLTAAAFLLLFCWYDWRGRA